MLKFSTTFLTPQSIHSFRFSIKTFSTCDDDEPESAFAEVAVEPPVEIFHITQLYEKDTNTKKVNLGEGVYRTDEGEPFVLPVVKKCEDEMFADGKRNHEYLPILGNPKFCAQATELLLGKNSKAIKEERVVPVQTVSGTGAMRLGCDFLVQQMKRPIAYCPDPGWEDHNLICKAAGFEEVKEYTYWHAKRRKLHMRKIIANLAEAPEGSVIILHAAAHNPTGTDPTKKEWKQIAEVMKARKLFPFFDSSCQGFASGDPNRDAWAVRYFIKQGFELLAGQSFSKNMGLYSSCLGNLVAVVRKKEMIPALVSQFTILARINYSSPPAYGSRIVEKILSDDGSRAEWEETVNEMACRVKAMREALRKKLEELETPGNWDHITNQTGMFSYTGLKPHQIEKLREDKSIYMLKSGRINVCSLTSKNVCYVAEAISKVVKDDCPETDVQNCE